MSPRFALLSASCVLALFGCLSVAGIDKDYTADLPSAGRSGEGGAPSEAGGAGGDGGTGGGGDAGGGLSGSDGQGGVGGAGAGGAGGGGGGGGSAGAGTGGQPAGGAGPSGGQAGAPLGGGPSAVCPPTSFTGLPSCAQAGILPCLECACNDTNVATLCSIEYKKCVDDEACARTIECAIRGCPVAACEGLIGNSQNLLDALQPCFAQVCASECAAVFSGNTSGG
jgi:hypothetical protein